MSSAMEKFREFAADPNTELGSLELKVSRKVSAKFYMDQGKIYSLVIKDRVPPLAQRLKWSLDQDVQDANTQHVIATTAPARLAHALLETQSLSQRTIDEAARDFFLSTTEEILFGWQKVKTQWNQGDQTGRQESLYVPPISPGDLLSRINRRSAEIEQFAKWAGVELEEVFKINIEPGIVEATPTRDAEQLVLNHAATTPTLLQLIAESGGMGAAPIVRATYGLWEQDAIRLALNGEPLRNEPRQPEPQPRGKVPTPPITKPVQPVVEPKTTAPIELPPTTPESAESPDEPIIAPELDLTLPELETVLATPESTTTGEPTPLHNNEQETETKDDEDGAAEPPSEPVADDTPEPPSEPVADDTPEDSHIETPYEVDFSFLGSDSTSPEQEEPASNEILLPLEAPEVSTYEGNDTDTASPTHERNEDTPQEERQGVPEPDDEFDPLAVLPITEELLNKNLTGDEGIDAGLRGLADSIPLMSQRYKSSIERVEALQPQIEEAHENVQIAHEKHQHEKKEREAITVQVEKLSEAYEEASAEKDALMAQLSSLNETIEKLRNDLAQKIDAGAIVDEKVEATGIDYEMSKTKIVTLEDELENEQRAQKELAAKLQAASKLFN